MPEGTTYILYKSRHGSSKEYAAMLRDSFPSAIVADLDQVPIDDVERAAVLIIVSRTYMGKIAAQDFLEKYWSKLKKLQVFLVAVGLRPPQSPESKASYEGLSENVRKGLAGYWKLPGKIIWQEMNFTERLILKTMQEKAHTEVDPLQARRVANEIQSKLG